MELYVNYPEMEKVLIPMRLRNFSYHAHLHNCLEFSFCTEGEVLVSVDGNAIRLLKNQGIIIPPNSIHSYRTENTSQYYTVLVGLDVLPELSELLSYKYPTRLTFSIDPLLVSLLLDFYVSKRSYFAAKALLYRASEVFTKDNTFSSKGDFANNPCIKIMEYIRENFQHELTLDDIAKVTGYNYQYISKLVRKHFSMTFTFLLARYRVSYACNLLEKQKDSISQVALASGFGSIRSFNRVFRQILGVTPAEYRQNHRNSPSQTVLTT